MTDYSQLLKRLRKDVFYGDERTSKMHLHNPLHMEAADAIDALQARVAKLEAERIQIAANCEAIRQEIVTLRALLKRNPS